MDWNFDDMEPGKRYKLMVGLVVPRPIAWVTTRNADGVVNADRLVGVALRVHRRGNDEQRHRRTARASGLLRRISKAHL